MQRHKDDGEGAASAPAPAAAGGPPRPPHPALVAIAEALGWLMAQRDHAAEQRAREAADVADRARSE